MKYLKGRRYHVQRHRALQGREPLEAEDTWVRESRALGDQESRDHGARVKSLPFSLCMGGSCLGALGKEEECQRLGA